MGIIDLKDMPHANPAVTNGMDSVSAGKVKLGKDGKPECYKHKAMNCVSPDRKLWRCLQIQCHVGCYIEDQAFP